MIQLFIYDVALRIYAAAIFIASLFNEKAKRWRCGRKTFPDFSKLNEKRIWFHCASLGEFEQAHPLIEKFKAEQSDCSIVISFFSPSGYEVRKNYLLADAVVYLPLDTKANAQRFVAALKPDAALFVKYEFWFHYLNELNKQQIPTILFSSAFRKEQIFFRWYGSFFIRMLRLFSAVFVQDKTSQMLLAGIEVSSFIVPDTRFDRVYAIAQSKTAFPLIEKFKGNSKLLIAGSTWRPDEELIVECINRDLLKEYKYIIAPHELHEENIDALRKNIQAKALLYSELTDENATTANVVIIDNFGMLASLYAYAEIAYIGGGFGKSVHNILEAAVYGMPVIFGTNYHKALEAHKLLELQAAFSVSSFNELKAVLKVVSEEAFRKSASEKAKQYVQQNTGGTEMLYGQIQKKLLQP
ncbi:MAG: 3-deoxy-D-manno-octulosonic acid transferase [Chitinophagales bacterium]|nr:3-deoxy-D-manno-octulosonic acid transferase [Chitinophagales bacterium]